MSLKYYDPNQYGSYVVTMVAFAGGRQVLNNVRVSFVNSPSNGTPIQQLKKFVDWLDKNSEGSVKYVRSSMGYPVMDKIGYDLGVQYKKGLIGLQNNTNTQMKQWVNIPFLKPDISTEDISNLFVEFITNFEPARVVPTPGVNDPVIILPTKSKICAKALMVGKDPSDYDISGQSFDDDGADGMAGSAE